MKQKERNGKCAGISLATKELGNGKRKWVKWVDLEEGRNTEEGVDGYGAEARVVDTLMCPGPRRAGEEGGGQQERSPTF